LAVVVDGVIEALLPAGETEYTTGELSPGSHRIDVIPLPAEPEVLPRFFADEFGRRVFLSWPASSSADCVEYRIFTNGGSGSIDYSEPFAVVSDVNVDALRSALPSSGSGSGRVSIYGRWTGATVNDSFTVEVKSDGTFRHDLSGSFTGWVPFSRGQEYGLGNGLYCVVEDLSSLYSAGGDSWAFRVGPETRWLSGELAEGSWSWNVRAVDGAGNESGSLTGIVVVVSHRPEPVGNLVGTWNGTQIALSWDEVEGAEGYHIYSNYSLDTGVLGELVIEGGAWEDVGSSPHSFSPPADGVWRFYVRAYDANDLESDDITLVTVDTTAVETAVALNVPELVSVVPIAGGKFLVSWNYPVDGGGDVTDFLVLTSADDESVSYTLRATVEAGALPVGGVASYVWESGVFADEVFFTVRATDGDNETVEEQLVLGVPDGDAPVFTGVVSGGTT
jgi:hypothetical protein